MKTKALMLVIIALLIANLIAGIAQTESPTAPPPPAEPTSDPNVVICWRETTTRYPTETNPVMDEIETASRTEGRLDSHGYVTGAGDHVNVCKTQAGQIIFL